MKINIFLCIIMAFSMSCSKNHIDEFETGNNQKGIVGKWKLVRSENGNGTGDVNVIDKISQNVIITFDSTGHTTNPMFECKGKYNFTWVEEGKNNDPNMTINFDCPPSGTNIKLGPAKYYAGFEDNNHLYLNNASCDEQCKDIYRRLKE